MNKTLTLILQGLIVLIGLLVLGLLIRLPLTEGRAVNLDLFHIYADPLILYSYGASVFFFMALYKAFKFLGYIRQHKLYSFNSVEAVKSIKNYALVLSIFIVLAAVYIWLFHHKEDDPAGFIAICIAATLVLVLIATAAAKVEKRLVKGLRMKSQLNQTI